jgi:hypothetical protein
MNIAIEQKSPIYLDHESLRREYGWPEVARGLNQILMGWLFAVLGIVAIGGLVGFGIAQLAANSGGKSVNLLFEICILVGTGAAILLSIFCYGKIVLGGWRCLKNVPERCGARWMMFVCMIGLGMGPALNVACSIGGVRRHAELSQGPHGFRMPEFDESTRVMRTAGIFFLLVSWALFMGFLRAVALCFNDRASAWHAFLWLGFLFLMCAATYYLMFVKPRLLNQPSILMGLGLGWIVTFLWHMLLILLVRLSITHRLAMIKSPLEM